MACQKNRCNIVGLAKGGDRIFIEGNFNDVLEIVAESCVWKKG